MVLVGDDPADRVADRPVVDGVGERVAGTRRREVDEELEVDLERLRPLLLLGEHAVHAHLPQVRRSDAVHPRTLPVVLTARAPRDRR